jgi:hypothetical protein|tara:strand:- start:1604 stop:1924 length:321 start_codon:yes stop_codon:yes gene_type:complete
MGNNSQKTISSAGQGSESERSGQCSDRDNEKQRPLAEGEASGETPTSLDGIGHEEIVKLSENFFQIYLKGFKGGHRMGCEQTKDFYEAKIVVLEKQVEHWKEADKG